jgi:hypothetical protein
VEDEHGGRARLTRVVLALGATFLLASTVAGFTGAQAEELPAEASTTTSAAPPTSVPPTSTTSVTVDPPAAEPEVEPEAGGPAPAVGAAGEVSGAGGGFSGDAVEATTTTITAPVSNWWATDFDVQIQVDQSVGPTAPTGTVDVFRRIQGEISFTLVGTVPVADDGTDLVTPDSAATFTETEDVEAGVWDYQAVYSGEPALPEPAIWYDTSSSLVETTTIDEAPVSITWVGAPPNPRAGEAFPLQVLVERAAVAGPGPVPTGPVVFYDDGSPTGVQFVQPDGTSTNVVGGRPEGLRSFTAEYTGFSGRYSASGLVQQDVDVLPPGTGAQLTSFVLAFPPVGATFAYGADFPLSFIVTNFDGVPNPRPTGDLEIYRSDDDGATWTLVDTQPLVDDENAFPTDSPGGYVYWEETDDLPPDVYDYYAEYAGEPVPADPDVSWFGPSTSGLVNGGNGITVEYGSTSTVTPVSTTYDEGEIVVLDVVVDSIPLGGADQEGDALLYRDDVLIQTLPLTNGTAQFLDGGVFAGSHEYYVVFDPSTFAQHPSTSPTVGVEVLGEATTTSLALGNVDPVYDGQTAYLNVIVDTAPPGGATPAGDVELRRDGDLIATQQLSGGATSFEVLTEGSGTFEHVASFVPASAAHQASSSTPLSVPVEPVWSSEVLLSVDASTVAEGTSVTLSAEVLAAETTVTDGTVRFFSDGLYIADVPASDGMLVVTPPIGYHRYTAQFLGFLPGITGSPVTEELVVTITGELPADVEVQTSDPVAYGDDFTLQAEVIDLGVLPFGSRSGPTGTVEFYDSQVGSLGTARIELVDDPDEGFGWHLATLEVTRDLPPGDREVWAVYGGETSHPSGFPYEPSSSLMAVQPVLSGTVSVQLQVTSADLEGVDGGECVTLLANVVPTVGSAPVDGTVTYTIDGEEGEPPSDLPRCPLADQPDPADPDPHEVGGAYVTPSVPVGSSYTTFVTDGPHDFGVQFGGDSGYAATSISSPVNIGGPTDPPNPPVDPPVDPGAPSGPTPGGPSGPSPLADPSAPGGGGDASALAELDARLALLGTVDAAGDERTVDDEAEPEQDADDVALGEAPKGSETISSRFDVARSLLADSIPTSRDIDWSAASILGAVWLALLLILLVELPATLVNATLEDHHDRVVRPFGGIIDVAARADAVIAGWPTGLVLLAFAAVSGLIGAQLDPEFGLDATSAVLLVAMVGAFAITTLVLEVLRLPYLRARTGLGGRLKLFPLVLVVAAAAVVVCRTFDFQPGYVFGIAVALLLSEGIEEEDEARSLAMAGVGLLVLAAVTWFAWQPIADRAIAGDASVSTIFFDALLSTTWVMSLQLVLFEFSGFRGLHGKTLREWSRKTWVAIYFTAAFLLVKMVLHPSAWRWGGLPSGTFVGMMALFGVLLIGSVLFWAWFNLRAAPDDERPNDLDDDRMAEDGLVS